MESNISSLKKQATPIVVSALMAATFTFFQSLAAAGGLCPPVPASPQEAGALGAVIKGSHSAYMLIFHKHIL